jgi:hypothetical protein
MQTIFTQRANPLIRRHFPDDALPGIAQLWADRWRFLDALDTLPQTVCHLDAFRRNLFARRAAGGTRETVAVDWAFTSIGALGEELAALTAANLAFFAVDAATAREFTETVFAAYLDGLHDAGWRGDSGQVRLAFAISTPLRYALPIHAHHLLTAERVHWLEQVMGRSIDEVADCWATCIRWMLDLAREARRRMDQIAV